jgi:hypothetical protein
MAGEKEEKKALKVRVSESLLKALQRQARIEQMSVNSYINLMLTTSCKNQKVSFEEKVGQYEKKEVESRVYFTISEVNLLKEYALSNGWSLSKEIRYRVISSLAKKSKLSGEELKAIYSVRSSINVLGANLNRLIRNHEILSDNNIKVCQELTLLIKELQNRIHYLEKCSYSRFKLKGIEG